MKSLLAISIFLSGCMSLPHDPSSMTPEQLREISKDKNANVTCAVGNNPYGRIGVITVQLDQKIVVNGSVQVTPDCNITIKNEVK